MGTTTIQIRKAESWRRNRIEKGIADVKAGRVYTLGEVKKRLGSK